MVATMLASDHEIKQGDPRGYGRRTALALKRECRSWCTLQHPGHRDVSGFAGVAPLGVAKDEGLPGRPAPEVTGRIGHDVRDRIRDQLHEPDHRETRAVRPHQV